ncbi:MAG: hypothetical protein WD696_22875 [Bryobacteraceae bacterium]
MRRQLLLAMFTTAAIAIPALADERWGYPSFRDDRGHGRNNRGYGRGGYQGAYGRQSPRGNPVMAARRDLEMVFRRARVDNHEANHFRRALRELAEFDQNAARRRFDRGSLDRAIDNMADLAKADQLHPRDRQLIRLRTDDLRYFRNSSGRF